MSVGGKVPADLRVAKLHSRNFRVDQVWRTVAENFNSSKNCAVFVYVFALIKVLCSYEHKLNIVLAHRMSVMQSADAPIVL